VNSRWFQYRHDVYQSKYYQLNTQINYNTPIRHRLIAMHLLTH
jgi:hypothetical protein